MRAGGVRRPRAAAAGAGAAAAGAVLQPEVRRWQGRALQGGRRGPRARDRADRARPPRGTSSSSCATPSPAAPTGWRWPAATARRRSSPSIAAELDLPYACIPAGTRNHFALDLGVDRDDVVGALDAFVDGGERRVDLAEVNGRVFVNNVSLGLYADAVQRTGYRDAKLRTILDTVPEVLGPEGTGLDLRWTGPGGHEHAFGSRDPGLQQPLPAGPRGRLRHAPADRRRAARDHGPGRPDRPRRRRHRPQRPWREWTAPAFEVDADRPVPAGIDGEAVKLEPPLRFRIRPGVLRVRIAPPASRRLALGDAARGPRAERSRAGPDRRRARRRTPVNPPTTKES